MAETTSLRYPRSLMVALTGLMTALTMAATIVISVYIPASQGFFNLGESMVYTAALLFGPLVGAVAGGVGSMFADLYLNFPHYAPGTLLIKGLEGYLVGWLSLWLRRSPRLQAKWITLLLATGVPLILAVIGVFYYVGSAEISGALILIPPAFWILFALLFSGMILVFERRADTITNVKITAALIGGSVMVLGYLFYGTLILGLAVIFEVPFNILQMLVGISIALPITRTVEPVIKGILPVNLPPSG